MLSKIEGKNYVIADDDGRNRIKINRNKTKESILRITKSIEQIGQKMRELYEKKPDLYYLLNQEVFERYSLDFEEGSCWRIDGVKRELEELLNELETNDDEILPKEQIAMLRDLGYKKFFGHMQAWEKVLEDTEEREVVEEILLFDDKREPLRRIRTIMWEKTDYGKSSKSIKYKKLPIGKKLMQAIKNTENQKKE